MGNSSTFPGSRFNGCSWFNSTRNALYLFGGFGLVLNGSLSLNDVWRYDVQSSIWSWLSGSNDTSGVVASNSTSGIVSNRLNPVCTMCSQNGKLYLGFGEDTCKIFIFIFFIFIICLFYFFIIFSKIIKLAYAGPVSDLWEYTEDSGNPRFIFLKGNFHNQFPKGNLGNESDPTADPGSRYTTSMTCDKSNNLWLVAGSTTRFNLNNRMTRDVWKYDS